MNIKTIIFATMLLATSLMAEVKEKWKINVGSMFVTQFETELKWSRKRVVNGENTLIGKTINTKDQLGLESESSVLRFDGYYRFNKEHKIEFSYFGVNSNSNKITDTSIELDGNTITAGVSLQTYYNMKVYKLNYAYSFYHTDKVELALLVGLHVTQLEIGYNIKGQINSSEIARAKGGTDITAPLPVVGFEGQYSIIPKVLFINYQANYFYLDFGDYAGAITSSTLKMEYRFWEHLGIGAGYNINNIAVRKEDSHKTLDIDNRLSGAILYLSYTY